LYAIKTIEMDKNEKLDKIISILTTIKGWVVFMGIVTLLSVLTWIFVTFYVVNDVSKIDKKESWQERLNSE
jgi:hypothetical protein